MASIETFINFCFNLGFMPISNILTKEYLIEQYIENKKSMKQIANELGCSHQYIHQYLIKYDIKRRKQKEANYIRAKGLSFDITKIDKISYILGVLNGDGFVGIYKGTRGFRYIIQMNIGLEDRLFGESFAKALSEIGLHPKITVYDREKNELKNNAKIISKQPVLIVKAMSKPFVLWYKKLDFEDQKDFVTQHVLCKKEFIRGFYESDGCFSHVKNNNIILMDNNNKERILFIQQLCKDFGFIFTLHEDLRNTNLKENVINYRLYMGKQKDVKTFIDIIRPRIKNKRR